LPAPSWKALDVAVPLVSAAVDEPIGSGNVDDVGQVPEYRAKATEPLTLSGLVTVAVS
jgi:hypothetical protein